MMNSRDNIATYRTRLAIDGETIEHCEKKKRNEAAQFIS